MKTLVTSMLAVLFAVAFAQEGMMGAPVPEKELKAVEFLNGNWEGTDTFHEMDGSKQKVKTVIKASRVVGGRFIQSVHSMKMENMPEPMEGMMMLTYDTEGKLYRGYWFDSTGGKAMEMTGNFIGEKFVLTGSAEFPGAPTPFKMKASWTKKSDTHVEFLLEMDADGKWMTVIEGDYKRTK